MKHFPQGNFVRYADDILIHCNSTEEAERLFDTVKTKADPGKATGQRIQSMYRLLQGLQTEVKLRESQT